MSIFERISQLVLANLNDLLDQAEDPEKMLNQFVREMETQRRHARESLIEMITQERLLEADWAQHDRRASRWGATAVRAVEMGKDELARESLLRKHGDQELAEVYEAQLSSQRQAVARMKAQMNALDVKYQRTLGQRDLLIARQRRARARETFARSHSAVALPDWEGEFTRMDRRVRSSEARATAIADVASDSMDAQLLSLDVGIEIEQELAILKAQFETRAALCEPSST